MSTTSPEETFRQEAAELLEALEADLLALDNEPSNLALTDSAFRAMHTLKGSGAMFGFTEVADFVHRFETVFDGIRKGEVAISAELIGLALEAKDHIAALVAGDTDADGSSLLTRLGEVALGQPAIVADDDISDSEGAAWIIEFWLPGNAILHGTDPALLLEEFRQHGATSVTALTGRVKPLSEFEADQLQIGWSVELPCADPQPILDDIFMFLREETEISIRRVDIAEPALVEPETVAAPPSERVQRVETRRAPISDSVGSDVVRVAASRLDDLMDRIGELVISQARLAQIAQSSDIETLKAATEDMDRLIGGLRDTTMGIRMVPIETIYGRFRRLVRDLSAELGKDIRLETVGGDTELDKSVIDRLADPIVHLIRNAVDHGLEAAEVRAKAGKPTQGTVTLSACYRGTEVAISIRDDGRGLNLERIRAKAVTAGLMAESDKLPDSQIFGFVFAPGFSTAAEVTALSGRGVGMDVVKRTVEELRGRIELKSEPGAGTTATLSLPLTLAIIDGMHVRIGEERYVIPLSTVQECVEVPEHAHDDLSILDVRGSIIPLVHLRREFAVEGEPALHQKIVIVTSGDMSVGLVVDQILGNAQTVVKQLSKHHEGIRAFSGATILGDGTVSLIIDPARVADGAVNQVATLGRAA